MSRVVDFSQTALGIEFGSTRIKAVLIDQHHQPLASGDFSWENQYENGIWTYATDKIHTGLQACFAALKQDVKAKFGVTLTEVGIIGISGMMHGYLPFDKDGRQLVAFRTWRNILAHDAAEALTALFGFKIPRRWSIAHLYHAMCENEPHLPSLDRITTLAGYIHRRLTGRYVLGVGEASGMFPIDPATVQYDAAMADKFDKLIAEKGYAWRIRDVLPAVLPAGADAGRLTEEGARFLDPAGDLKPGIPFAPPEGDAGTGMVATGAVSPGTGSVSLGTSAFTNVIVDRPIGVHSAIDVAVAPSGSPVAMVHCNNGTSDIDAWFGLFGELAALCGADISTGDLYTALFQTALNGKADSGLVNFNFVSGENVADVKVGCPLFVRSGDTPLALADMVRALLQSTVASLRVGMDILTEREGVTVRKLYAHGGFFKTPTVGQTLLSAAMKSPVSTLETAGEGGPYGMALLAGYALWHRDGESLATYLDERVLAAAKETTVSATDADIDGFDRFLARWRAALPLEQAAGQYL